MINHLHHVGVDTSPVTVSPPVYSSCSSFGHPLTKLDDKTDILNNSSGGMVSIRISSPSRDKQQEEPQPQPQQHDTCYEDDNSKRRKIRSLYHHWLKLFGIPTGFLILHLLVIYLLFSPLSHHFDGVGIPRSLLDVNILHQKITQLLYVEPEGVFSLARAIHLFLLSCSVYLLIQAFSIPGGFFLNLLCGALVGGFWGTVISTILTAIGSCVPYLFTRLIGRRVVLYFIPQFLKSRMDQLEIYLTSATGGNNNNNSNKAILPEQETDVDQASQNPSGAAADQSRHFQMFMYLLSARLFPLTPNWVLNLACPLLDVPLAPFFYSTLLGVLPSNWVIAKAGEAMIHALSSSIALQNNNNNNMSNSGGEAIVIEMFETRTVILLGSMSIIVFLLPALVQRSERFKKLFKFE